MPKKTVSSNISSREVDIIRNILLQEDRKKQSVLQEELNALSQSVSEEMLIKRVGPQIELYIEEFKNRFPKQYSGLISKAIANEVKEAQDDIVEALYPVLGQLIKKYVQSEIQKWLEQMDRKTQASSKFFKSFLPQRGRNRKVAKKDIIQAIYQQIEEVFVVEKDTGFILASFTLLEQEEHSRDVFLGLLTAIKGYSEDAMNRKNDVLNTIQYDNYNIVLHDLHSFFVATFVNGPINELFKSHLQDKFNIFAAQYLESITKESDTQTTAFLSEALKEIISAEQKNLST